MSGERRPAIYSYEGLIHKMPNKKVDRRSPRNRCRSGTGILELAFLLLPTFAIIGGFIDIGMVVFTWNTLQNAVREGTRYAVTYQVDSSNHQLTSIKNRVSQW